MKKHFTFKITDAPASFALDEASVRSAEALDGLYVIRTSLKEKPEASEVVAHYKRQATVELAFRALKSVSLRGRPIHHRRKNRVICHVFLCMLAYYVEYHRRQPLAPLLLAEEAPAGQAAQRDKVVAPAKRSPQAEKKARRQRTADGGRAMSYGCLMDHLSGLGRDIVEPVFAQSKENRFTRRAELTPTQQKAFELLNIKVKNRPASG